MSYWEEEPDVNELKRALQNCYMMACRKRSVIHRYEKGPDGREVAIPVGPNSNDSDWDHIKRFCEETGLKQSVIRTAKHAEGE